jgi:hypothetical protein
MIPWLNSSLLGLNDERLSGPRLDAYKEGYDAMSESFANRLVEKLAIASDARRLSLGPRRSSRKEHPIRPGQWRLSARQIRVDDRGVGVGVIEGYSRFVSCPISGPVTPSMC